jgi:hypothetical protein
LKQAEAIILLHIIFPAALVCNALLLGKHTFYGKDGLKSMVCVALKRKAADEMRIEIFLNPSEQENK